MLMEEPTPQMVEDWKTTFAKYRSRLKPNKKTATQIIEYLQAKYPLIQNKQEKAIKFVLHNIIANKPFADKIPPGKRLKPLIFSIPNEQRSETLYQKQEEVFKNSTIIIGLELETSCVFIEGSGELADEVAAFQGLDEEDLENFYLVANYIRCLNKYDLLDSVLNGNQ
jgi:hypothetical protein